MTSSRGRPFVFGQTVCLLLSVVITACAEDLSQFLSVDGQTLDLRGKEVRREDWAQLRGTRFASVRKALLARSNADDAALAYLAGMALEELDLFGTAVTSNGLRPLRTDRLRKIDLSGTRIPAESLRMLASSAVEELSLRDTGLTDDDAPLLLQFTSLRRLDLSMTRTGDRTLSTMIGHPSLRLLDMSGTTVSTDALEKARKMRPQLTLVREMPSR